jgi:hypothetical protein
VKLGGRPDLIGGVVLADAGPLAADRAGAIPGNVLALAAAVPVPVPSSIDRSIDMCGTGTMRSLRLSSHAH